MARQDSELKQGCASKDLLDACQHFDELLKVFIKNPKSGRNAHLAAQVLFSVRKLENALTDGAMLADRAKEARSRQKVTVIPPIDKDDL